MVRTARSLVAGGIAAALLLYPLKADPVLPVVAMLGKEILKNIIMGEVKSQLFGALSSMGCKGAALAGVLASASSVRSPAGGIPQMPGAMQMPGGTQLPGGMQLPGNMNPAMTMGSPRSMAAARGADNIPTLSPDQAARMMNGMPDAAAMAQMMAMMQAQTGANAPRMGAQVSPEQMAGIQGAMAQMQQAMSQPLSRAETMAVFDELAELGVLTPAMRDEARDCITLAAPGAGDTLGMTGALMKSMVLPQLREAKAKLANLSPEEQDELAGAMIEQLNSVSSRDRSAFLHGYGQGFYPKAIVDRVKARLE